MEKYFYYDCECYPNIFTFSAIAHNGKTKTFEISERQNELREFVEFLGQVKSMHMIGYNSIAYDYPLIHFIREATNCNNATIYAKSQELISASDSEKYRLQIPEKDWLAPQVDLLMIHHFDNKSKRTSLKMLEFVMRADDIQELPFDPSKPVPVDKFDELLDYNLFDVEMTRKLHLEHTVKPLALRQELSKTYGKNFLNYNDTKIGKEIFQHELETRIDKNICIGRNGKRRQTPREKIDFSEIVKPLPFKFPAFQAVQDWFRRQVITETKGVFSHVPVEGLQDLEFYSDTKCGTKDGRHGVVSVNCEVNGFHFVFGLGGIHGSIESSIVESSSDTVIIDLDVVSYYPSVAIQNGFYPEHLSPVFCDVYAELLQRRKQYAKGTAENAALKLALNGVYGDSNNAYSVFYDPKYTMSVTINGQLALCLLSEMLIDQIPSLKMIQANTDGITVQLDRDQLDQLNKIAAEWEALTKLELESVEYSKMFIRDVNNYIAVGVDGKIKRKGCYEYNLDLHKNHSALVIQKAVEHHLVHGGDVEEFIRNHDDPFDFYLRTKIKRGDKLVLCWNGYETPQQRITRYYISRDGGELVKIMPPLVKSPHIVRQTAINKGYKVTVANKAMKNSFGDVNYQFYIDEAMKLINVFN
jgi:hypothetical protein